MCRFGMEHLPRREEQLTGFLWWCARLFWLVNFAQLLSKCPSRTKLCQGRSGTVNLRIPSAMLFQAVTAYELVSRSQNAFTRRERLYAAGCPVTRVWSGIWNALIDLPVPGGSAQAAHRHYTSQAKACTGL